ncbi:MAG: glycosyltransferase family 39 protein [Acidobacteriota bacterium]|nr:glycosyltransferase family 39 protein [Acidobacteriota bacterium]
MAGPSPTWLARHRTLALLAGSTLALLLALAGDRCVHVPRGLTARYFTNTTWQGPVNHGGLAAQLSTEQLRLAWDGAPPPRFSALWDGFLLVPRTGRYTLALRSDDGAWLSLDGKPLIDNGGDHSALVRQATVNLKAGAHLLSVKYFQDGGLFALDLLWGPAGHVLTPVPARAFSPHFVTARRLTADNTVDAVVAGLEWLWVGVLLFGAGRLLWPAVRRLLALLGREGAWPALAWVLGASVILDAVGLWWGLPAGGGWAPDELVPYMVLDGLQRAFSNGWFNAYPPLHFYVLSLAFSPVLLLARLGLVDIHGGGYTTLYVVERLISVVMATGTLIATYLCAVQVTSRRGALLATATLALTVTFVYYAKTANPDVPYVFWFAVSLVFYLRLLKGQRTSDYMLFAAMAALSICTKDQAYGLYALTPVPIVYEAWRAARRAGQPHPWRRVLWHPGIGAGCLAAAVTFALVHNFAFNFSGFLSHVRDILGPASRPYRLYPATLSGRLQLLADTARETALSSGWPLFVAAVAGLLLAATRSDGWQMLFWLGVPVVSYYVTFLNVVLHTFDRFMLPVGVILAIFAGDALARLISGAGRRRRWALALVGLVFGYSLLYSATVDALMVQDSRYTVEAWLRHRPERQPLIGVLELPQYLPRLEGYPLADVATVAELQVARPDYVVVNADYLRDVPADSPPGQLLAGLARGTLGYRLALHARTPSPWPWLPWPHPDLAAVRRTGRVLSNLDKINPTLDVYEREAADR